MKKKLFFNSFFDLCHEIWRYRVNLVCTLCVIRNLFHQICFGGSRSLEFTVHTDILACKRWHLGEPALIVIPDSYLVKDKLRINYLKKSTIPVYRASKSLADDLIFDIEVEKTPDSWSSAVCCFHSYRSF